MNPLTSMDTLDECLSASANGPVFIFKHSTSCPISGAAQDRLDALLDAREALPPFYRVKVIEDRPVSNAIAERLDVTHKSPQLILVRDGQAVWTTSHHNIQADTIDEALREHAD
jgi:bacillithiol system protein YtxJ